MAKKEERPFGDFSRKTVLKKRRYPKKNLVILIILLALQAAMLLAAFLHTPTPQDVINEYNVTVSPRSDGSLDISYNLTWTPLDENEPLTWIEIGMANPHYTVDYNSLSPNIKSIEKYSEDGYVAMEIYLDKEYVAGETLGIFFTVNQREMLCYENGRFLYEFVPGWFNAIPVEKYKFNWIDSYHLIDLEGAVKSGEYRTLSGSLEPGEYAIMRAHYVEDTFFSSNAIEYMPFDGGGAHNDLEGDRVGVIVLACLAAALILIVEAYLLDSMVSYHRGRGFLMGYGYHVHTYGLVNPHYKRAEEKANGSGGYHGGRYHGGGCACACACACAGDGRAGCSQKDTYSNAYTRFREENK